MNFIKDYLAANPDVTAREMVEKIKDYYTNNEIVPDGKLKPFTPFELLAEISQKIPFNNTNRVLVIYSPEWGAYLHLFTPVPAENITVTTNIYNKKIAKLCDAHGMEYCVIDKILYQVIKGERMKFDVVVGNPPFQSKKRTGTQPLWPLFVEQGFNLLSPTGYLAMITPNKWCGHTANIIKGNVRLYKDIFKQKLVYANIQECSKYFPGVGAAADSFSYFVIANAGAAEATIKSADGTYNISPSDFDYLPLRLQSNITAKVLKKLNTGKTFKFKQEIYSTNEGKGAVVVNAAQRRVPEKTTIFIDNANSSIPRTMKPMVSGELFPNATQETLDSVFRSTIFKFIFKLFWNNDSLYTTFYNTLPYVDLTRFWTNEELYQHFGLTKEEIKYVEDNVK